MNFLKMNLEQKSKSFFIHKNMEGYYSFIKRKINDCEVGVWKGIGSKNQLRYSHYILMSINSEEDLRDFMFLKSNCDFVFWSTESFEYYLQLINFKDSYYIDLRFPKNEIINQVKSAMLL